jgi:hypothetical protein
MVAQSGPATCVMAMVPMTRATFVPSSNTVMMRSGASRNASSRRAPGSFAFSAWKRTRMALLETKAVS